ncbi:MAG: hypothetical protein SXG53_24860 [Pseudomonadota bacterium]|nr:hypothetical protein [Pseudomonadota bacterium]
MSRHFFDCEHDGRSVRVRLGYDRPLDEYFLHIEFRDSGADDEHTMLYASINDPSADTTKLSYFAGVLAKYGIRVPNNLFREVAVDAFYRVGNRYVQHFEDGHMVEPTLN